MSDEKKHPTLSKEDIALWEKVQNSVDEKKPVKRQEPEATRTPSASSQDFADMLDNPQGSKSVKKSPPSPPAKPLSPTAKKAAAPKIETFNHQEARSISSGKQTIEGMIDLHGYTQRQAEGALRSFLKRAQSDGKRFVLVITGKGQKRDHEERGFELGAPEPGVLKRQVPVWLDDMAETVLSYKTAHKKHGGQGALYVRLRKLK